MTGTHFQGALALHLDGRLWYKSQTPPLYVTLIDQGNYWLALPTDQSGGMQGGDSQILSLRISGGGQLLWHPPAAALFRSSANPSETCRLEAALMVEAGSRLHFCPKPGIPRRDARISQRTTMEVETGAELLFWDSWTSGMSASREHGVFQKIENRLKYCRDGKLLFQENWTMAGSGSLWNTPAGLGDNQMMFLGLAQGQRCLRQLEIQVAYLVNRGGSGEIACLEEDLWIARVLNPRGVEFPGL